MQRVIRQQAGQSAHRLLRALVGAGSTACSNESGAVVVPQGSHAGPTSRASSNRAGAEATRSGEYHQLARGPSQPRLPAWLQQPCPPAVPCLQLERIATEEPGAGGGLGCITSGAALNLALTLDAMTQQAATQGEGSTQVGVCGRAAVRAGCHSGVGKRRGKSQ